MKQLLLAIAILLIGKTMFAQHQELSEKPATYKGKKNEAIDTTSLLSAFKRGTVNGHFRYYFMTTQNAKGLTNYFANAAGGGLRYETAMFHQFQFGVSGFYTFNIGSSDLSKIDSTTGAGNRYEIGLFDIENPYNTKDIDRLEELFLKYHYKKSTITFGRQLINSAFINLQDGRMRPTGVEGLMIELNEIKKTKIEAAWLYAISPRSTTKWYTIGESIGIYPTGVNANGSKSQYANHVESENVLMLNTHVQPSDNLKLHAYNIWVQNVFNTTMFQVDYSKEKSNHQSIFASAQIVHQYALHNGGNDELEKSYVEKNANALTYGARVGIKNDQWNISLNYNRITNNNRYLMPREWGREPFFTFLPRERNEGLANVHAVMGKVNYIFPRKQINTSLGVGYYQLPSVNNFAQNKYGLPSYTQLNFDTHYIFTGMLKGLEAQLLLVGKINSGDILNNKKYEINKVNMLMVNFVLNYHF